MWNFSLALGDVVGVGVLDDPKNYAPTVGRQEQAPALQNHHGFYQNSKNGPSGTPVPTPRLCVGIGWCAWPPLTRGLSAEWLTGGEKKRRFHQNPFSPSVTACAVPPPSSEGGKRLTLVWRDVPERQEHKPLPYEIPLGDVDISTKGRRGRRPLQRGNIFRRACRGWRLDSPLWDFDGTWGEKSCRARVKHLHFGGEWGII